MPSSSRSPLTAISNASVIVASTDASGQTAGIQFWGTSLIVGPRGEWLASTPTDGPATLAVELDLGRSEPVRRLWPYPRDRRIDAYDGLPQRYLDR